MGVLMTTQSEVLDDVDLQTLRPGSMVDVETSSRHYRIECLGGDAIRISGHPEYCPEPVPAQLQGALDQDGQLEFGHIERGRRLLFWLSNDRPITTTRVVSVHVDQPSDVAA
jgi:hypothetical protein